MSQNKNSHEKSQRDLEGLTRRSRRFGELGALKFLMERQSAIESDNSTNELDKNKKTAPNPIIPSLSAPIELEEKWMQKYSKPPMEFPAGLQIPRPLGLGNDYRHLLASHAKHGQEPPITVCILTYNRASYLDRTLAALCKQDYPLSKIEVVVSDDGSSGEATLAICQDFSDLINIKYFWHPDKGFRAAEARNNAISLASHDTIILIDVDMLPGAKLVRSYAEFHGILDKCILIGPRKYVEASRLSRSDILDASNYERLLTEINTNNAVADLKKDGKSIDWRLPVFERTNNLVSESLPFRVFASGNVCFSRRGFNDVGGFDKRFKSWGYEDTELGFRFYNNGKYFIPILDALAYHQEPPGGENETNREEGKKQSGELFGSLCPFYRKLSSLKIGHHEVPKVSIYIPAFNCENTICDAIESALRQTYKDLEVCICDDGSTDKTLEQIDRYFSGNSKVRIVKQANHGIGAASNSAVRISRGLFIGQLDSDDILLDDAVELCIEKLESNPSLGLVYTSYFNWDQVENKITEGYNYPLFTREKAMTAMIFHHFRMFRRMYWARTDGFNERILNAVDYDMFLKIMEKSEVYHINKRAYIRSLHGLNTSIKNFSEQVKNTAYVVNASLHRQDIPHRAELINDDSPKLKILPKE